MERTREMHDEFADVTALAARHGLTEVLRPSRLETRVASGDLLTAIAWSRPTPGGKPTATDADTVLLHGVGIEAHTWDAAALALGTPSVAVDLPGHGRSSWRKDAVYAADATAPEVLDALDAWHVPSGVLVGHSLGAIVAARMTSLAPERVTGLVLVDMSPDFTQRAVDRIVRQLEREPDFADLDEVVTRAIELRIGDDREALRREAVHATVRRPDGRLVRRHHFPHLPIGHQADVGRFADAWPDLERAGVPILLVRGDRGYVSPKLVAGFAERLPTAEIVTVPARHAVPSQAPLPLAAALRTWRAAHDL